MVWGGGGWRFSPRTKTSAIKPLDWVHCQICGPKSALQKGVRNRLGAFQLVPPPNFSLPPEDSKCGFPEGFRASRRKQNHLKGLEEELGGEKTKTNQEPTSGPSRAPRGSTPLPPRAAAPTSGGSGSRSRARPPGRVGRWGKDLRRREIGEPQRPPLSLPAAGRPGQRQDAAAGTPEPRGRSPRPPRRLLMGAGSRAPSPWSPAARSLRTWPAEAAAAAALLLTYPFRTSPFATQLFARTGRREQQQPPGIRPHRPGGTQAATGRRSLGGGGRRSAAAPKSRPRLPASLKPEMAARRRCHRGAVTRAGPAPPKPCGAPKAGPPPGDPGRGAVMHTVAAGRQERWAGLFRGRLHGPGSDAVSRNRGFNEG